VNEENFKVLGLGSEVPRPETKEKLTLNSEHLHETRETTRYPLRPREPKAVRVALRLVDTTLKKFENSISLCPTLKTLQMFSVHTRSNKLENATITGHFLFVLEENPGYRDNDVIRCKMFSSTLKRKTGILKLLWFEERC